MISPWPLGSKMGWDCFEVGNMYLLKQRAVPVGGKSHIHRKPQHIELVKVGFNPLPYVDLRFFPPFSHANGGHSHWLSRVHLVGRFKGGSAMTGAAWHQLLGPWGIPRISNDSWYQNTRWSNKNRAQTLSKRSLLAQEDISPVTSNLYSLYHLFNSKDGNP